MYSLMQKLLSEFVGTFTLIFVGCGSICADAYLRAQGQHGLGLLGIALAFGLAIAIMVTAVGHISGGHLNPAVTIGFWVTKKISTVDALAYWISQLLGATFAAYLLTLAVPEGIWRSVGLGAADLAPDFTRVHGIILEAVATFLLVFVVFATAADPKGAFDKVGGFAIGLTITMGMLFAGPFTGGAINPARAFGPALVAHHWQNQGVYWVGPLIGGVLGGWIYATFLLQQE
jgi:MIP family channel proteins